MKLLLLFTILLVWGCAHQSTDTGKMYSRVIASEKLDQMSARNRLMILKTEIEKAKDIFPVLGNPRYYLFENFMERTGQIINDIQAMDSSLMDQQINIPAETKIIKKYLQIVSAHKVMETAGIYLNYNQLIEKDSSEVAEYLRSIASLVRLYEEQIDEYMTNVNYVSLGIRVETREEAQMQEYLGLLQYLSLRIDRYYEDYISSQRLRNSINSIVNTIVDYEHESYDQTQRFLTSLTQDKRVALMLIHLKDLELKDDSSIEGSEMAFERVMSVQLSSELFRFTLERVAYRRNR